MDFLNRVVAILFLLIISEFGFAGDKIRIAIGEWDPYMSEKLQHYGLASHIVKEAFALEGVEVEYGFFPWARSYSIAKKGEWDGTAIWGDKGDRAEDFFYSDKIVDINPVYFHLKSYPFDWNSIEDLQGLEIGASIGYDYGEAFQHAERFGMIQVQRVVKDSQSLRKLLDGRIKIFPIDKEVGYALIQKLFTTDDAKRLTHHPKPVLESDPHYLLLSKKVERNKLLLIVFNKGLRRLKASGRFDQYITASRKGKYIR